MYKLKLKIETVIIEYSKQGLILLKESEVTLLLKVGCGPSNKN